jgi:23S rRNA G2445 N2-methylase RlmL
MAFDDVTQRRLMQFVSQTRELLTEEFTQQLQNDYGLNPRSGVVTPLEELPHLDEARRETARILRETVRHYQDKTTSSPKEALERVAREQAFTVLNRMAAVRMAEARGILVETIGRGYQSTGFQMYARVANGGLGETGETYRHYLFSVFDELAVDLRVLFDRYSPSGLLFPRETVLLALLEKMNHPDMVPLWAEDETIGWIYEFFNSDAERKKMRDPKQGGSAAPRNSYEMAVRNQFFTPRYIVQFLTDNSLGRTWYEMTGGQTALAETCRYLVKSDGEIAARAIKDPREIRLLDPACGSMHFGLYAFDLFETIYAEAYDHPDAGAKLRQDYPDREAFRRDVPRLIIENNIHGVDIDPRAVQIAGLSLWLRAQRGWQEQKVRASQRPQIRRSNIVCAEPMPGEESLRREFLESLHPNLRPLVAEVFEKMANADTLGSLLRIEDDLREVIARARREWEDLRKGKRAVNLSLDMEGARHTPVQREFELDASTDESFFQEAEAQAFAALREYAENAEAGGSGFTRRLFVDDAARGFAFVDLWQKKYDVVVMNPPFGDAALPSKPYLEEHYGDTKGDVYKAFVECFQDRLVPGGYLGAITSRTGFFLGQSADWRERVVLRLYSPLLLADLGEGVLNAMVETAAYVLRSLTEEERKVLTRTLAERLGEVKRDKNDRFTRASYEKTFGLKRHQAEQELSWLVGHNYLWRFAGEPNKSGDGFAPDRFGVHSAKLRQAPPAKREVPPFVCLRLLKGKDNNTKRLILEETLSDANNAKRFVVNPLSFYKVPSVPFAYWVSEDVRELFQRFPKYEQKERTVKQGLVTTDDFRFVRSSWEVPVYKRGIRWFPFAKGGNFSPFYASISLCVDWLKNGAQSWAIYHVRRNVVGGIIKNPDYYFKPGLTWPLRTHRFSPQVLPSGVVISVRGSGIYSYEPLVYLGLFNSSLIDILMHMLSGQDARPQFDMGDVSLLPVPPVNDEDKTVLSSLVCNIWSLKRCIDTRNETSSVFHLPALIGAPDNTPLSERATAWANYVTDADATFAHNQAELDAIAARLYGIELPQEIVDETDTGTEASADDERDEGDDSDAPTTDPKPLTADLLSYLLGAAFGRWDIRYATGQRTFTPLPDPFDPLPVCSPGTLQNEKGLPAEPADVPADYPLPIPWDGILVDDPGHPYDIEQRVQDALALAFPDNADAIEQEACQILGVRSLREYFGKPTQFFDSHLKRYSKSRRQAPLYLPLSTASGSYTLWVYYHRLTDQTLYTAVVDYVEQKLKSVAESLAALRARSARTRDDERELERLQNLEDELKSFREELLRVAALPYKPNLNDGVQITSAPLYRLFRLPRWQNVLKETWDKLEKGTYDWAHLAYSIWPERVEGKCKTDKSLAIAHDREDLYQ